MVSDARSHPHDMDSDLPARERRAPRSTRIPPVGNFTRFSRQSHLDGPKWQFMMGPLRKRRTHGDL